MTITVSKKLRALLDRNNKIYEDRMQANQRSYGAKIDRAHKRREENREANKVKTRHYNKW